MSVHRCLPALSRIAAISFVVLAIGPAPDAFGSERKAHRHGAGTLNLAIEGRNVEAELEAPGADVVGFEHAAASDAEKQAVAKAADQLRAGATLFVFPEAAGCRLIESEVESPLLDEKHHDHKGSDTDAHAEFHAHYHFRCDRPGQLTHLDTTYFETFPAAQALTVRMITAGGQSARQLTPKTARLKF
ncbi:MAG: DUF2796 domain-containing protein [Alphaproteobacteria bacterium]|nr:DUF2796 domain-containing protein [Alphaproteobacteria bacterium]